VIQPTGAKLDIPTADFWYIRDGKVQEFNCHIGTTTMFAQLGDGKTRPSGPDRRWTQAGVCPASAMAQARLGRPGEARACLAALDDERASSGEIRNTRAVICLAEGDPAGALGALRDVLDGTAPGPRLHNGHGGSPAGRARSP
jgi:hypothetical protein